MNKSVTRESSVRLIQTEYPASPGTPDGNELRRALLSFEHVEGDYCGPIRAKTLAGWMKLTSFLRKNTPVEDQDAPVYLSVQIDGVGLTLSPQYAYAKKRAIFLFDCWPENRADILQYLKVAGVQDVIINGRGFATEVESMNLGLRVHFVPEAVDPEDYSALSKEEKDIDVIEFGRKYERYHSELVSSLEASGRTHLHQRLETREEFIESLGRSKISVCFPRSLTESGRDPKFEFLSMRYVQSIASNCLVVGKAPENLIELFGYNPVVEADLKDPGGQIESILENFDDYQELIKRNREELCANHTWKHRAADILGILAKC
ncbi:MAG: glycosyltransferase [Verrucomicrobiota bacterium]